MPVDSNLRCHDIIANIDVDPNTLTGSYAEAEMRVSARDKIQLDAFLFYYAPTGSFNKDIYKQRKVLDNAFAPFTAKLYYKVGFGLPDAEVTLAQTVPVPPPSPPSPLPPAPIPAPSS